MSVQYTIRAVPDAVDHALRQRAKRESRSINAVATDALARGLDVDASSLARNKDLERFIGSWQEDPAFDEAVKEFEKNRPRGLELNIALDTNAYSDFMRGDPRRVSVVRAANQVYLPLFVVGELRAGFVAGSKSAANAALLQEFLGLQHVFSLLPDEQTTHFYATMRQQLRKQGTPIPSNDLWIASLVVQHGLILCTSDAHFAHLPQVPRC